MPIFNHKVSSTLRNLSGELSTISIKSMFESDGQRHKKYQLDAAGIFLDYSKNRINDDVMQSLIELANESNLSAAIEAMFTGKELNSTEKRPVLHTALRSQGSESIIVDGQDVIPEIRETLGRMEQFCEKVQSGEFSGHTGKPLRTIVNIGIGGSFLGPKLVSDALKPYWKTGYDLKYLANIDGTDFTQTCANLDPETTLFVICSKSFSTLETLKNAQAAREWFLNSGATEDKIQHHFIAVSTNIVAATEFGISPENMFPIWDWVGGRYSLWSAIGLPQALVLGFDTFSRVLAGANDMDQHFRTTDFEYNLPVILAILGIWYHNFMDADSHAVLVYDEYLKELPNHLQQVDMESNGKQVSHDGQPLNYQTGPIIWGGTGTNGQHAYHQLIHQGTKLIPCDFIMPLQSHNPVYDHHDWLFANYLGQQQAMLEGKDEPTILKELLAKGMDPKEAASLAPHKVIPGNKPCNSILFDKGTPEIVGALIAMYEHKIFVQGVIWDVNSFDQWGVELGKVLGNSVFDAIKTGMTDEFDSSSADLINRFREAKL